jgi:hypothetical protein
MESVWNIWGSVKTLWLDALPTFRCMLQDLTLWLRGACLFILPDNVLGDVIHMAWEFICVMLLFPQMCAAFEMFLATPVSILEEARFHFFFVQQFIMQGSNTVHEQLYKYK